jgi:hypothetical protein
MVEVFRIAGGNVSGYSLIETKARKKTESGRQHLSAMQ